MLAKAAALFVLLLLPFGLAAQTTSEDLQREVLELIEAGDFDALEAHISRMQDRFERGEVPADHVREQFMPFGWADLDLAQFAESWYTAHPDSPYAQLALTWSLHRFSWMLRGSGVVRDTYPGALQEFSQMQQQAWALAFAAHTAEPRLIPASDALIRLANGTRQQGFALEVLEKVMETDPNSGTLLRATDMIHEGWGWHYTDAEEMCNRYAADYWDAPAEPLISCKIETAYRFKDERGWVAGRLSKGDLPHLGEYRVDFLLRQDASREEAQIVYDIFSGTEVTNYQWASLFDDTIGQKYGHPPLREVHWKREREQARKELVKNPYSPDALFEMMKPEFSFGKTEDGRSRMKVTSWPDLETVLEYSERLIVSDPYNPESWKSYVDAVLRSFPEEPYVAMEPYRINAIITSNHDVNELLIYLQNKVAVFDVYQRLRTGSLPENMGKAFESASLEHDILCPFMRALAVKRAICDARKDYRCDLEPQVADTFTVLENAAKRRGICRKERTLPAQSLAYTTMTFPETQFAN